MRTAKVFVHDELAGTLKELGATAFEFCYREGYAGPPVSLSMPVESAEFRFDRFPPFFEGLLPEGEMLEGLLRQQKLDGGDLMGQLLAVGREMIGAVTVASDDS